MTNKKKVAEKIVEAVIESNDDYSAVDLIEDILESENEDQLRNTSMQ